MKSLKKDQTKANTTKQPATNQQPAKPAVGILDLRPDGGQTDQVVGGAPMTESMETMKKAWKDM